jgi:hypothetical protein
VEYDRNITVFANGSRHKRIIPIAISYVQRRWIGHHNCIQSMIMWSATFGSMMKHMLSISISHTVNAAIVVCAGLSLGRFWSLGRLQEHFNDGWRSAFVARGNSHARPTKTVQFENLVRIRLHRFFYKLKRTTSFNRCMKGEKIVAIVMAIEGGQCSTK